jgi:hypothetical protein
MQNPRVARLCVATGASLQQPDGTSMDREVDPVALIGSIFL